MKNKLITGRSIFIFAGIGDLSEWLKEHAWKVCIPLKGIEGSNPSVSAMVNEEKFFVEILQSMKDFSFYVGQCDDLEKRERLM